MHKKTKNSDARVYIYFSDFCLIFAKILFKLNDLREEKTDSSVERLTTSRHATYDETSQEDTTSY